MAFRPHPLPLADTVPVPFREQPARPLRGRRPDLRGDVAERGFQIWGLGWGFESDGCFSATHTPEMFGQTRREWPPLADYKPFLVLSPGLE
jgi:hypothetical protein